MYGGGGGWNAISYQILDPLKNLISDIRPPKNKISDITRSQKSDIWLKKIRYQILNKISNIRYQGTPVPPMYASNHASPGRK